MSGGLPFQHFSEDSVCVCVGGGGGGGGVCLKEFCVLFQINTVHLPRCKKS